MFKGKRSGATRKGRADKRQAAIVAERRAVWEATPPSVREAIEEMAMDRAARGNPDPVRRKILGNKFRAWDPVDRTGTRRGF